MASMDSTEADVSLTEITERYRPCRAKLPPCRYRAQAEAMPASSSHAPSAPTPAPCEFKLPLPDKFNKGCDKFHGFINQSLLLFLLCPQSCPNDFLPSVNYGAFSQKGFNHWSERPVKPNLRKEVSLLCSEPDGDYNRQYLMASAGSIAQTLFFEGWSSIISKFNVGFWLVTNHHNN